MPKTDFAPKYQRFKESNFPLALKVCQSLLWKRRRPQRHFQRSSKQSVLEKLHEQKVAQLFLEATENHGQTSMLLWVQFIRHKIDFGCLFLPQSIVFINAQLVSCPQRQWHQLYDGCLLLWTHFWTRFRRCPFRWYLCPQSQMSFVLVRIQVSGANCDFQ